MIFVESFRSVISKIEFSKVPVVVIIGESSRQAQIPVRQRLLKIPRIGVQPLSHNVNEHSTYTVLVLKGSVIIQSGFKVRSEERRVGKECVSTCRSRWSP